MHETITRLLLVLTGMLARHHGAKKLKLGEDRGATALGVAQVICVGLSNAGNFNEVAGNRCLNRNEKRGRILKK